MRPVITAEDVGDSTLVVRTDYSDETAWRAVVAHLSADPDSANHLVEGPAWNGATVDDVLAATPRDHPDGVVFIADAATMQDPHPLLAVTTVRREDCEDPEDHAYELSNGREFRVLPAGVLDVSANLFIANMDFPEFAAMAQRDPSGWYRGV
ncbi:DUF6924 domain-containing protein [Actinoplanes sp. NPDC049316]|uniref:DUF6924 domain-containing protein n=1 Tax=Actinoplanes sp. NPDC049316 TaxID=3154727 RepID=UPI00344917DF